MCFQYSAHPHTHTPQIHCFLQIPTNYDKIIKLLLLLLKTCWRQSVLKKKATEFCQVQSPTKSTPKNLPPPKKNPSQFLQEHAKSSNLQVVYGRVLWYSVAVLGTQERNKLCNQPPSEKEREREGENF
jgi:hypothetical protein